MVFLCVNLKSQRVEKMSGARMTGSEITRFKGLKERQAGERERKYYSYNIYIYIYTHCQYMY